MYVFDFSAKRGDTWDGYPFQILRGVNPIDLTDSILMADFKASKDLPAELTMSSETIPPKLEIVDALLGRFKFSIQKIEIPAGCYSYDLEITFSDGTIKTWLKGTMTVLNDTTNNNG